MMDSRGTHPAPWPSVESRADTNQASDKNAASATQQVIAASALFSSAFEKELATNAEIRNASRALGKLAPVDLPSVFAPDKAYPLLLQAYGFSSYLMAPERGVRRLVADALQLYRGPITDAASGVLAALLAAAEMAAATALPEAEWPDHVRLRVLDHSQACIRAWHSTALAQLEGLLAAECLCPEQEAFAGLRVRLQQRLEVEVQQALKEKSKAAVSSASAAVSGAPGRTQPDPAAETETETEAEAEAEYFMGSLDKLDRHGRWRRRWFVYQASDRVLSYGRSPKSQLARTFVLQGGAVVPRGTADQEPAFHLQVTEEGVPKVLTLRASAHSTKAAWTQQLAAAAAPPPPKTDTPPAALAKTLSAAALPDDSTDDASPVARKITATVFLDPVAEHSRQTEDEEAGPEPEPAASDALLAEIDSQAAARSPTAHEAAVLAAVLQVASEYVEQVAGRRLRGSTQRIVSSAMLLGRREEMRHGLLALLLEPGACVPDLNWA